VNLGSARAFAIANFFYMQKHALKKPRRKIDVFKDMALARAPKLAREARAFPNPTISNLSNPNLAAAQF
jgi:hypothetical protein